MFMSVFHNGKLRTMKASYMNDANDLRIIRPFVYVRERLLRDFSIEHGLPVIAENCPACFEAPKERARVKQLLAAQEHLFPNVYVSMCAAMKPLMAKTRGERILRAEAEAEAQEKQEERRSHEPGARREGGDRPEPMDPRQTSGGGTPTAPPAPESRPQPHAQVEAAAAGASASTPETAGPRCDAPAQWGEGADVRVAAAAALLGAVVGAGAMWLVVGLRRART